MIRVRGRIGDLPVDLEIELDAEDWQRVGSALAGPVESPVPRPVVGNDDRLWALARERLRAAGELPGPQLLAELAGLAGSPQAAKRLLVRLRHCPQVTVDASTEVPRYRWVG